MCVLGGGVVFGFCILLIDWALVINCWGFVFVFALFSRCGSYTSCIHDSPGKDKVSLYLFRVSRSIV